MKKFFRILKWVIIINIIPIFGVCADYYNLGSDPELHLIANYFVGLAIDLGIAVIVGIFLMVDG